MKHFTAAKALIVYQEKILLLQDTARGFWGLPGGRAKDGETIEETLVREVREETGLCVTPQPEPFMQGLWQARIDGESCEVSGTFFICRAETDIVSLCHEHKAWAWINPASYAEYNLFDEIRRILSAYLEYCRRKDPS